jgi:hypothetical protein
MGSVGGARLTLAAPLDRATTSFSTFPLVDMKSLAGESTPAAMRVPPLPILPGTSFHARLACTGRSGASRHGARAGRPAFGEAARTESIPDEE